MASGKIVFELAQPFLILNDVARPWIFASSDLCWVPRQAREACGWGGRPCNMRRTGGPAALLAWEYPILLCVSAQAILKQKMVLSGTVNKLKTTPTPNKNGSYGIKVGVCMP